ASGTWGSWGPWSICSSSCGDGVALRMRRCLRVSTEELCRGEPRQYRVCQLEGCPRGAVPFRAMQCSLYDTKPVLGTLARYRWVPFHGAPNVCDLNCLAAGHNFYYTFGRVLDGTRCSPDSPDLCVGGRCLSAGCDGILGSGVQPDACGQCGGGPGTCIFVHRLFQGVPPSSGYFGYLNVTKIPAGATNIKVTDKSRNYLALMSSDQRYVLNGDWSIAWPGAYEVAGTRLLYARAADGTESLEAPGPTAEELHVMVLLQEPNPRIEYEFWAPRQHGASALRQRQPQPRGAGSPQPSLDPPPLGSPLPDDFGTAGHCGKCRIPKGHSQRIHHFCQSDFGKGCNWEAGAWNGTPAAPLTPAHPTVFQARIVATQLVGQETRHEVRVLTRYRRRFPLLPREYVWVPSTCGCPRLQRGRRYVLMVQRHINREHTLNRIVLRTDGYARPWSVREERRVREAAHRCGPPP
ncbi:ATL5 protein, partial [Nothoprocta pentlandii]|nr:ATL5 protein [Nothoprocta pentlandii]